MQLDYTGDDPGRSPPADPARTSLMPTNKGFAITTLWAFIAVAADGDEGLVAFTTNGVLMPMVCSDRRRIDSLRDRAAVVAKMSGQRIELRRWDPPGTVEETYG